jgi:hypothetical protein
MTTAALRDEFRRDPNLPMLIGDDIFIKGIRKGIKQGEYVYRRDALLYGQGDASASIQIDEQAVIFTMAYAREQGIWPRPQPKPDPVPQEHRVQGGIDADSGVTGKSRGFAEPHRPIGALTPDVDKGSRVEPQPPPVQPRACCARR